MKPQRILYILLPLILVTSFGIVLKNRKLTDKITQKTVDLEQTVVNNINTIAPQPTQILETGLPDSHLINTTFVPQAPEKNWDQPWQDACEEAALLTLHYYYTRQTPSISQMVTDIQAAVSYEITKGWGHSINMAKLAQVATDLYNLTPEIITNPTLDQIKTYLSQDIPVIVPANGKTLYQENKHFKDGGPWYHNLTIVGYDDNRQQFITHDVGTQFGAYYRYSYKLFLSSIHDLPDSENIKDINQGSPKVLILLQ